MPSLSSAEGILALFGEPDLDLKSHALKQLNEVVDTFWPEIASAISEIESLIDNEEFPERHLAAAVASKVFFNLEDLDLALKYALIAGSYFNLEEESQYSLTLIAKCIDLYIAARVSKKEEIDSKLEAIVERMFERCYKHSEFSQALGLALECRRIDHIRYSIQRSNDQIPHMLSRCFGLVDTVVQNREFRHQVLRLLVDLYSQLDTPDYVRICQCLLFLDDASTVAKVLNDLLKKGSASSTLQAYQVGFELIETEAQFFLKRVIQELPEAAPYKPNTPISIEQKQTNHSEAMQVDTEPSCLPVCKERTYEERVSTMRYILSGDASISLYLQFLYSSNNADMFLMRQIKEKLDPRNSTTHTAAIMAHAIMYAGTAVDTFIRDEREWLKKAQNWSKFTAIASTGVIHKGHRKDSLKLLEKFLPQPNAAAGSPYQEGGALYALGLIHANHAGEHSDYLLQALKNALASNNEVNQHGVCLAIGLTSMATGNEGIVDELEKSVLYTDNAVAGEAAGLAIGLVLCGTASERSDDLIHYAHDTQHEKIIRGLAVGIALTMYGREEEAETLIEQLLGDMDPILRFGGCYTIALAFVGTGNSEAVKRLLHVAVTDVNNDVRKAAVMSLGFVLCNSSHQVPRVVKLLSESFNPFHRYGAAMAVGIACAGTGMDDAISLLEPLLIDRTDFVRQGALIAMAMVLMQMNEKQAPKVGEFRPKLMELIGGKTDVMTKLGAVLASGILDAGGRNVCIGLTSTGHRRMAAIVGMAVFTLHWHWFPFTHFISLAFQPTALIGLNQDLEMPRNFTFRSNAPPSLYAYPPKTVRKIQEKTKELVTATLSVTAKAKAKAAKKKDESKDVQMSDVDPEEKEKEQKEKEEKEKQEKEEKEKEEKEPLFELLSNPARVTISQRNVVALEDNQRYEPLQHKLHGMVMLVDLSPDQQEEIVVQVAPKALGVDEEEEAPVPEPFEYDPAPQGL